MCFTMIDPATSWFEIVELLSVKKGTFSTMGKGKKVTCDNNYTKDAVTTFDKSSAQISNLVYKTSFSRYSLCRYIIYDNGSKLNFTSVPICSTYHTVVKASPGAAIFGRDMLFDIPFIADWKKIGEHRQLLTDRNTSRENEGRIDYDYKVGQKVLIWKEAILGTPSLGTSKSLGDTISPYETSKVQCGNKSKRINISEE